MKERIIDKKEVRGNRKETDETWDHFANALIAAFSERKLSDELFESAYTNQRIRKFDEKFLDSIVYNVPPAFLGVKHLFASDSEAWAYPEMKNLIMQWRGSEESPVFIMGYVGTGKTTFLKYSFGLKNKLRQDIKLASAIVNLKVSPSTPDKMLLYIVTSINQEINREYSDISNFNKKTLYNLFEDEINGLTETLTSPAILKEEIDNFLKPFPTCLTRGDRSIIEVLVKKKIEYLKRSKRITQFWIILDNIDQHYYTLHHRVLIDAVSMAYDMGCPLVVSMRYITLTNPEAREVYSAYFPRKLNLSLPNIKKLLQNRFKIFSKMVTPFKSIDLVLTGNQFKIRDLWRDLAMMLSLLSDSDIMDEFLLPLANYNIRRLLQIILNCFQSYYFYFDYFNNDRYLPNKKTLFKRVLFSHCLKNQDYFDPAGDEEEFFVINLFENENKIAPYNQTIRVRMLQGLYSFGKDIELAEFTRILQDTFEYNITDILRAIRYFMKAQLFAVKGIVDQDFNESIFLQGLKGEDLQSNEISIALTYAGRVHLDLMFILEYVEIMKFSTYVPSEYYSIIQKQENQKTFKGRINAVRRFINYLAGEEIEEMRTVVKNQDNFNKYFKTFSDELKQKVETQIKMIGERI